MKKAYSLVVALLLMASTTQLAQAADYTTFLTAARGFTEVTSTNDIIADANYYYLLTPAETNELIVGVGPYEAKPDWASEESKALRYKSAATDPVFDLTNFFTVEKSGSFIGLRNVVYSADLFQTHDNAGFMYVNTFTDKNLDEWSYLTPTFQNGYWLFESGKYPISSGNWACGYLGPWNNRVAESEPIALNRRNTTGDDAGHYRLWRIAKADLLTQRSQLLTNASANAPVNATSVIDNPSFETGNEKGWTLIGKDPNGNDEFKTREYGMTNKHGQYLMNAYQWWASSLSVSQTVSNLPAGEYVLSGVVATWQGRTVTFTANSNTVTQEGQGDGTGIRVNIPVTVGSNGKLTITAGSTGQWWVEGHEGETQTFFKLDDVQLHCTAVFLDGLAVPLPNDDTTPLVSGQWYYYESTYNMEYQLIGSLSGLVSSVSGSSTVGSVVTSPATRIMTLPVGRTYFKTTATDATLRIAPQKEVQEGTFTAVALNVDGLPNKIATFDLNPDGPGRDGTLKISQYLASKQYDFIGCSEDFNYNGALMELLDGYSCGTIRNTLSVSDIDYWQLIQGKIHVDTDGLNLLWKTSKISATNEKWTRWNDTEATDGNQYVNKGYRHYDVQIDGKDGPVIDVFILHMDAGDTNATWSRHSQWQQLAGAINSADATRPKLIIGDTNSRWTREDIAANFMSLLNSNLTASDVWVEFYRNGVYPTTDMGDLTDQSDPTNYTNYEIVDKIIYINPTAANTVQLVPQSFRIEQDYTYEDGTTPLGDHHPVVVEFKWMKSGNVVPTPVTLANAADNATAISNADGALADVTLDGRTLIKDGSWNTLCLPFDATLTGDLAGAELMELDIEAGSYAHPTGLDGTTLYLNFKAAESIKAGTPYIIKWSSGDNIANPTFRGVTVTDGSAGSVISTDRNVTFQGTYAPVPLTKDDKTSLYIDAGNALCYPATDGFKVNAFRAYFHLSDPNAARSFVLNFGGETTGISLSASQSAVGNRQLFDLQGRPVGSSPLRKGIYISAGKTIIKK